MQTAPEPLRVARTEGVRIVLEDGRALVDGTASWWTACHGYNHPHIRAAVAAQLERMPHVMLGGLVHAPAATLAARLARLLPGDLEHVFFSESGSVAVEVALKMALQFRLNRGERGRHRFIAFTHAYHGDTFAAMSVCDPEEGMHARFAGTLAQQLILPLPTDAASAADFERAVARHAHELTAVVVEPLVQAAGGMKFHSPETLAGVADVARRHDLLLILDEIATGFGRTGTLFACEQADVVPDIVTLSKALTGGTLPLAATVANHRVFEAFSSDDPAHALMHGPTFCGNPLGCAAANASLDLFEREPRLDQVAAIETRLNRDLESARQMKGVIDVRVRGAIGVIEVEELKDLNRLKQTFIDRGVFIRPFANVIYLTPALTITDDELGVLTGTLLDVIDDWAQRVF
jgi:adenosylmethionine-8-amino-7-oxononanoate aminotransferase